MGLMKGNTGGVNIKFSLSGADVEHILDILMNRQQKKGRPGYRDALRITQCVLLLEL